MSKRQKNKLIPKLRFSEFTKNGNWEEVSLGQLGELINGLTYSPEDTRENGLLVLRSSNIKAGEIVLEDCVYVREDIKGANLSKAGDILICVRNGSKALIGKNAMIPKGMPLSTHGAFMTVFRALNPNFVYQLFQTDFYAKQVNNDLGATINSINGSNFVKYKFAVPSSKEQQKIADCLSSLDGLIAAEIQKLEVLQKHKKGLMQQLFPTEGERVPKLRFKEFKDSGEWEEKTLGLICHMQAGKFVSASEIKDASEKELYPCYGGNGLRGYTNSYNYQGTYSLIGRQGALCGNVNLVHGNFYATEHAVVVKPEEDVNTIWLFHLLGYLNLNKYATGQAQPGLSVENLEKVEIKISKTKKEQQRIAEFLTSLDNLLAKQSQKVESLKAHKKGLMQQLFPSINEVSA